MMASAPVRGLAADSDDIGFPPPVRIGVASGVSNEPPVTLLLEQVMYRWESQWAAPHNGVASERFEIRTRASGAWVFHERRTNGVRIAWALHPLRELQAWHRTEPASLPDWFRTPTWNHLRRRCVDRTSETHAMVVRCVGGAAITASGGGRLAVALERSWRAMSDPCLDSHGWFFGEVSDPRTWRPNAAPVRDRFADRVVVLGPGGWGFSEAFEPRGEMNRVAGPEDRWRVVGWERTTDRASVPRVAKHWMGSGRACVEFEQRLLVPEWERLKRVVQGRDSRTCDAARLVMDLLGERARARWLFLAGTDELEEPLECELRSTVSAGPPPTELVGHPVWATLAWMDAAHGVGLVQRCAAEWRRQGVPENRFDYLTRFLVEAVEELDLLLGWTGQGNPTGGAWPPAILCGEPPSDGDVLLRAAWLHRQTTFRCLEQLGVRVGAEVRDGLMGHRWAGMATPYAWVERGGR